MLRDAYGVIKDDLYQVRGILRDLAAKYRDTPMVGRTHNQHAVPITFGCKVANWLMEIQRQILRLEESAKHMFVVNLFGAAAPAESAHSANAVWNSTSRRQVS